MIQTAASSRPIDRRSLAEILRDALQERILAGEFADDEKLVEDSIASWISVSPSANSPDRIRSWRASRSRSATLRRSI